MQALSHVRRIIGLQGGAPVTMETLVTDTAPLFSFCAQLRSIFVTQTIDSDTVTVYNRSMQDNEQTLTIEELAEQVGTAVRTIRFYIAEGLLPGPGTRGKAATYSDDHLLRLRLIRQLSERHVPLAEMRALLARLSYEEAQALLAEEEEHAMQREQAAQAPSPKDYLATLLSQARAARQAVPPPAPPVNPAPPLPPVSPPPASPPMKPYQPAPALSLAQPQEVWQQWELAPGVELHVRADVAARQRRLIERLLWAASVPNGPTDNVKR